MRAAEGVAGAGAKVLRGGAFKPRTSPYDFQGLEIEGLKLLQKAKRATGLAIVTEVMSDRDVALVAEYADMLQVGARNMQNFVLLKALGRCGRPVLLKRGMSCTVMELLMSAEYVVAHGNSEVCLCERGIRTFETVTRNTCDIAAIPALNELTHLPVILDPSHATGKRSLVPALCRAGGGDRSRRPDCRGAPCAGESHERRRPVPDDRSIPADDAGVAAVYAALAGGEKEGGGSGFRQPVGGRRTRAVSTGGWDSRLTFLAPVPILSDCLLATLRDRGGRSLTSRYDVPEPVR